MKRTLLSLLTVPLIGLQFASAQVPGKAGFRFVSEGATPGERILSSSVIDILPLGLDVVLGTGSGLSIWHSSDSTWSSFDQSFGIGEGSISALDVKDGVIWAAAAYTASTSVGPLPAGSGVGFSSDNGATWTWFPQPVDPDTITTYMPTTTNVQNVTYDLLITSVDTSTVVWITSWAGGLRKYSTSTNSWELVTPDTFAFYPYIYYNHRAFSVAGDDSVLWVGTAQGINKSTDGGGTWEHFTSGIDDLSGNFVVALGWQKWSSHEVLWAGTWPADDPDEYYGVSKTEDGGQTWEVVLTDSAYTLKAHNFAFDDSAVYVTTNLGLYKSIDGGQTWGVFPFIQDSTTGETLFDPEVYGALLHETPTVNSLWVGTGDGVDRSGNYGNTWTVFRAFQSTSQNGQPSTYAYPNPYSPRLMPNGVRFQYDMPASGAVTLKIFDFALDEVTTVINHQYREAGDHYDIWYGIRSDGKTVANGVYYYRLERNGADTVWGKVAIIR